MARRSRRRSYWSQPRASERRPTIYPVQRVALRPPSRRLALRRATRARRPALLQVPRPFLPYARALRTVRRAIRPPITNRVQPRRVVPSLRRRSVRATLGRVQPRFPTQLRLCKCSNRRSEAQKAITRHFVAGYGGRPDMSKKGLCRC